MRKALGVLLTAAAVAAPFASPVGARLRDVQTRLDPSTITWDDGGGATVIRVEGTISSPKPSCVPGRRVYIETGPSPTLKSFYGEATTDAVGHFVITGSAPDTAFYSIFVDKRIVRRTRCKTTAAHDQFNQTGRP